MIYHPVVAIWWFWIQFRYGSFCWCCFCVFCKWCGKWKMHIIYMHMSHYVLHEQMKSWSEVGHFHLFILGFRGDWKALVAMFNLVRNYNTDKVGIFSITVWSICFWYHPWRFAGFATPQRVLKICLCVWRMLLTIHCGGTLYTKQCHGMMHHPFHRW